MPRLPRVIAQPTDLGRAASPGDFGGGQGTRALAGAAQQIGQAASAYVDAGRRAQVSNSVATVSQRLAELDQDYDQRLAATSQADDPVQAVEDLRREQLQRRDEILQDARSQIRGQPYQQLFEERTFGISQRFGLQANERARARGLERIRAQTVTSVETLTDLIEKTDNDDLRGEYLSQIKGTLAESVASGAITEDRAAQIAVGVEDKLQRSELIATAQQGADEIFDTIQSPQERLRAARERFTGEQRDRVVARIKDRNAEEKSLREAEESARFDAAVTRAQAGKLSREQALDLGLPGRELNTVMAVIDGLGKPPRTDPGYYNDVSRLVVDDPTKFANARLDPAKLGSQYTRMVDLQRSVRERGQLDAGEGFQRQRVEEALAVAGITGAENQAEFRRKVDEEIADTAERLKRKPSKLEVRAIIDGLTVEVSRPKEGFAAITGFFSSEPRRFELDRNEGLGAVPAVAIPALTELLEFEEKDATESQIVKRYQELQAELLGQGFDPTPELIARAIEGNLRESARGAQ